VLGLAALGLQLGSMLLKVFSNLNDSLILLYDPTHKTKGRMITQLYQATTK